MRDRRQKRQLGISNVNSDTLVTERLGKPTWLLIDVTGRLRKPTWAQGAKLVATVPGRLGQRTWEQGARLGAKLGAWLAGSFRQSTWEQSLGPGDAFAFVSSLGKNPIS